MNIIEMIELDNWKKIVLSDHTDSEIKKKLYDSNLYQKDAIFFIKLRRYL